MAFDQRRRNRGACHYCGIDDHYARDCKRKKRDLAARGSTSGNANQDGANNGSQYGAYHGYVASLVATVASQPEANATSARTDHTSPSRSNEEWLIDSGATFHMSFRRDWFTDYKELSPAGV